MFGAVQELVTSKQGWVVAATPVCVVRNAPFGLQEIRDELLWQLSVAFGAILFKDLCLAQYHG